MTEPWLHIVGIGEDGVDGLAPPSRAALAAADLIIGGERHHRLSAGFEAERLSWPKPYKDMLDTIADFRGRRVAILVTGDPTWFSAGTKIARRFAADEIAIYPHVSAFQHACARMQWSLPDVETLTVHGRPVEGLLPAVRPGARLVLLTRNGETPREVARVLTEVGYGPSTMTVLGAMGGPDETRQEGKAESWTADAPDFHVLCVECRLAANARALPRGPGLPDDVFDHDGKMTKRDVRAITLARLAPQPHGLLWDIGAGCGSVAIEWIRMALYARAIGIEPNAGRRALAEANARALGAPALTLIDGRAPDAVAGLEPPDAVFIGGGLSPETVALCLDALKPHGRLVANAVTLESERTLIGLHAEHGGDLVRLAVASAEPIGAYRGWRPSMPVTQWSLVK